MARSFLLPAALLAASCPIAGHAAVVVTEAFVAGNRTAFPVSNVDLLNGITPTVSAGSFTPLNANFALPKISDGSASNGNGSIVDVTKDTPVTSFVPNKLMYELTFALDTSVNTRGYDLASIVSTSNGNDERVNQDVEILVSVVGDAGFTSLARNAYRPGTNLVGGAAQVTFVDTDGFLATGVDEVAFRTYVPALNPASVGDNSIGATVFAEFDVLGTPTQVPEPASLALLATGGVALLRRRGA